MPAIELDVNAARLAHLRWEMALEDLVDGKGGSTPLQGHEDCDLGTWIYGTGLSRYGKSGAMWQLKSSHKKFHVLAADTLAAVAAGNTVRANETLESVRRLSGDILFQLTALELDVIESCADQPAPGLPGRLLRILFPQPPRPDVRLVQSRDGGGGRRTLNVTGARLAHLKWIRDLQRAFRGHGKAMAAQPSDECSLGVWIHGTAMKELGQTETLKALDAAHKRFHHEVDIVLSSLRHRKFRTADEAYEDALALSGAIVSLLTRLQFELMDSTLLSSQSSRL